MIKQKGMSSRQMSSLYKKTKRRLGKKKAFKYVGRKKVESKWQSMGTKNRAKMRKKYKDSDRDGVPNKWDCEPYNKYRQDDMPVEEISDLHGKYDEELKTNYLKAENHLSALEKSGEKDGISPIRKQLAIQDVIVSAEKLSDSLKETRKYLDIAEKRSNDELRRHRNKKKRLEVSLNIAKDRYKKKSRENYNYKSPKI